MIPTAEIIRFYYAPSTRLAQALFWGEYGATFNAERSGVLEEGVVRVHLWDAPKCAFPYLPSDAGIHAGIVDNDKPARSPANCISWNKSKSSQHAIVFGRLARKCILIITNLHHSRIASSRSHLICELTGSIRSCGVAANHINVELERTAASTPQLLMLPRSDYPPTCATDCAKS
jgi:hypothetical protein